MTLSKHPHEIFNESLETLCWSKRGLSIMLNVHLTTIRRWAHGTQPIPENVVNWLEDLASYKRDHALPKGW